MALKDMCDKNKKEVLMRKYCIFANHQSHMKCHKLSIHLSWLENNVKTGPDGSLFWNEECALQTISFASINTFFNLYVSCQNECVCVQRLFLFHTLKLPNFNKNKNRKEHCLALSDLMSSQPEFSVLFDSKECSINKLPVGLLKLKEIFSWSKPPCCQNSHPRYP